MRPRRPDVHHRPCAGRRLDAPRPASLKAAYGLPKLPRPPTTERVLGAASATGRRRGSTPPGWTADLRRRTGEGRRSARRPHRPPCPRLERDCSPRMAANRRVRAGLWSRTRMCSLGTRSSDGPVRAVRPHRGTLGGGAHRGVRARWPSAVERSRPSAGGLRSRPQCHPAPVDLCGGTGLIGPCPLVGRSGTQGGCRDVDGQRLRHRLSHPRGGRWATVFAGCPSTPVTRKRATTRAPSFTITTSPTRTNGRSGLSTAKLRSPLVAR
jgi:hypothetical protein